jgi:hypothetical protein
VNEVCTHEQNVLMNKTKGFATVGSEDASAKCKKWKCKKDRDKDGDKNECTAAAASTGGAAGRQLGGSVAVAAASH